MSPRPSVGLMTAHVHIAAASNHLDLASTALHPWARRFPPILALLSASWPPKRPVVRTFAKPSLQLSRVCETTFPARARGFTPLVCFRLVCVSLAVLMVLTSSEVGWYLPELVHPYNKFVAAGFAVTICSIAGGKAPIAEASLTNCDEECKAFWEGAHKALTENTLALATFQDQPFDCVFFVGGFGTMFDFPQTPAVALKGRAVFEAGGVVGAVCHGPICLANMTLTDGSYLCAGKKVAAFTNEEESQAGMLDKLPEHAGLGKTCPDVLVRWVAQTCPDVLPALFLP